MAWNFLFRFINYNLVVFVCFMLVFCPFTEIFSNDEEEALFLKFINKYGRSYSKGSKEYYYRYNVFKETLRRITQLNHFEGQQEDALYGITQYADYTPQEFKNRALKYRDGNKVLTARGQSPRLKRNILNNVSKALLPLEVDWREQKVVTDVKNQGDCGGCWAISAVETIESMHAIKTGELQILSVQQIIDCAVNGLYGCQGGDTCIALAWMNLTKVHIVTEEEYPFTQTTGACKMRNPPRGVQVDSFTCNSFKGSENLMIQSLASHGPLTAAVDAAMWQDYLGGIIKYHCENNHNHAVQIVGYNLTGPVPYYIVRNSWGTEFGLNGYIHIAIGQNLCGIADEVSSIDTV